MKDKENTREEKELKGMEWSERKEKEKGKGREDTGRAKVRTGGKKKEKA